MFPRALSPPYAEGVFFIDSTSNTTRVRRFAGGRVETVDAGGLFDARSLAALGSTLWVMDANGLATLVDRQTFGRTGRVVVPSAAGAGLVASNGVELRALNGSTLSTVWPDGGAVVAASFLRAHLFAAGIWLDAVAYQFTMQVVYFFALYSGIAWARDRRAAVYAVGGVLVLMFGSVSYTHLTLPTSDLV